MYVCTRIFIQYPYEKCWLFAFPICVTLYQMYNNFHYGEFQVERQYALQYQFVVTNLNKYVIKCRYLVHDDTCYKAQ